MICFGFKWLWKGARDAYDWLQINDHNQTRGVHGFSI